MQVSHETIYQTLYVLPRNALKAVLVQKGLRQHHEKRRPHSKLALPASKMRLAGGVAIDERHAEVDTRAVPRHWQGDLIMGEKNCSEVAAADGATNTSGRAGAARRCQGSDGSRSF